MSKEVWAARAAGLPPFEEGEAGREAGRAEGLAFPEGDVLQGAEKVRGEAESLLERLIALLQEARFLAESLREAAGEGERAVFLCGELGAVTGELVALEGRMRKCLAGLPGVADMVTLARILDRGEEGPLASRLEQVGRLASGVLQIQAANEKLFFLLGMGMERYLSVVAEASGGWIPYDRHGARRWTQGWGKRTLYRT